MPRLCESLPLSHYTSYTHMGVALLIYAKTSST